MSIFVLLKILKVLILLPFFWTFTLLLIFPIINNTNEQPSDKSLSKLLIISLE